MSFAQAELTRDAFLDGRLKLWQPLRGYRAAIDPVLLAAFVPVVEGQRVLDLGCGAGAAVLCLGTRVAGLDLHGLELQVDYAALARSNAKDNGLALTVHEGDLRQPPAMLRAFMFDHVLANPPFHPETAMKAADPGRDLAHREGPVGVGDWVVTGLRRLSPGGWLSLVHLAERLPDILAALVGAAGAIEVLPVAARIGRPAGRVLVRARKGSNGPLVLHAPLIMHEGCAQRSNVHSYTDVAQGVLRDVKPLLPATRISGNAE